MLRSVLDLLTLYVQTTNLLEKRHLTALDIRDRSPEHVNDPVQMLERLRKLHDGAAIDDLNLVEGDHEGGELLGVHQLNELFRIRDASEGLLFCFQVHTFVDVCVWPYDCLLYTSPSPRDS